MYLTTNTNFKDLFKNLFEDDDYDFHSSFKNLRSEVKENKLHLSLDMPGATKEEIVIETDTNLIIVKGVGGRYDTVQTKISVNRDYNIESTEAVLKDGVLKITISKGNNGKTNRIQIK